jgi:hypothetical protein
MALETKIDVKGVPVSGGAVTVREKGLLKMGQFSMVQNVKPLNPGFRKRKGQRKLHTTVGATYTTSELMTAYQFKKTRVTEDIYMVQSSDGDIQKLTTSPPGVTTGDMGTVLFSGTASPMPASYANLNDLMLFANGVDQFKLYPGASSRVDKFVFYNSGGSDITGLKGVLEDGYDYTDEVTDGQSTAATITAMDDKDAGDGIFICTQVPAKSFTFDLSATVNNNATTMAVYYWKNDMSWATVSGLSDGTSLSSAMLGQDGTVSFTEPSDVQERYLFGMVGYWYLIVSTADVLDNVGVVAVTYDASFASLTPKWDGVPIPAVVVLVEGTSTYDTYSADRVDLDTLATGKKIYICSLDPIEGLYFDMGDTPNSTGDSLGSLKYWNGAAWASVGTVQDGTSVLTNSGWMTFPRIASGTVQPRTMEGNKIHGYWYELIITGELAADTQAAIYTMPYYDVHDWGYVGNATCAWKERALWAFADKWQEYVYISASDAPQVITGEDSGILQVGDGRPHKIVCMKNFFNNVLVWQEEKGEIGGCVTMLQGYDVPTFGKLVLSTKLGTMNAKSADVVENVYTATATDEELKTVAFFISRYGVVACDGTSFSIISDEIQNYFDPNDTTYCIRRGYEKEMWLKHDPIDHVLRLGLVCGASATTPNVFPVYDLVSRAWYFDVRAQELSFWENVEAGSGDSIITQIGGGVDDGQLYQVNYGTADVSTAIDTYIRIEFPGYGQYVDFLQFMLTCKVQSAGDITITTYQNNIAKDTITLSMTAERTNDDIRRHLLSLNIVDQHVAVKIQNSSATDSMTIMAVGAEIKTWLNR